MVLICLGSIDLVVPHWFHAWKVLCKGMHITSLCCIWYMEYLEYCNIMMNCMFGLLSWLDIMYSILKNIMHYREPLYAVFYYVCHFNVRSLWE